MIKHFKIRCKLALGKDKKTQSNVNQHIDNIVNEWAEEVRYCNKNKTRLAYFEKDKSYSNLLCDFGKNNGLWETLQSMRNVENSALMKILPGVKLHAEE